MKAAKVKNPMVQSIAAALDDDQAAKRLTDCWLQIQEILEHLSKSERRKVVAELQKLGTAPTSVTTNHIWSEIGEYIKSRRKELELSQYDLALKIGFSSQFLGRIEGGKVPLPDDAFRKLIAVLDLDERKVSRIYIEGALEYVNSLFANVPTRNK